MNARAIVLITLLGLFGTSVCLAADASIGNWKLNEAKSTIAPGAPKNNTVVIAAAGDQVKITVDGVTGDGKPLHSEWTGKYDGKEYPVTGDANSDVRSYRKINKNTLTITGKKNGKVTLSGRIVVARNGKSRTVTTTTTDAQGKKVTTVAVYDKQ